tara:strand:+ start:459 stop:734 length:276 start_codon:yes stop_codon:yes gene_type:complete
MRTFKRGRSKGRKCPPGCKRSKKRTKASRPQKTKMQRKGTKKKGTKKKGKKPLSDWNVLVKETLQSMRKKDPNVPLKAALKEASKRKKAMK